MRISADNPYPVAPLLASLKSASHEAKIVLDHNIPSASQLRLSCEAKVKAPCAYSEVTAAPLASITLLGSVKSAACETITRAPVRVNSVTDLSSLLALSAKVLCRKARDKARLSANSETFLTSLARRTLHGRLSSPPRAELE